jgi:predicted HicB family RNase H-like nuclease
MRSGVHDGLIRVRAAEELIAEAEAKARRDNMTLSEFVRQAVRREVLEPA